MIKEEDYLLMKRIVEDYERGIEGVNKEIKGPYIITYSVHIHKEYNPHFGDNRECMCGHSYYRHFDPYEGMDACGCKYCGCQHFQLSQSEIRKDKLNNIGI